MVEILHVPFIYFPDPAGGTEVYVQSLIHALRTQGFEGSVAAPANTEGSYVHNGIRVFRFAKTTSSDLSYAYGVPDQFAADSFRTVLDRVRPSIVHMHANTAAVSELLIDMARNVGAKVVFTYHTPTVSCARGTMLLMGRSPCDGRLDVSRCTSCVLESRGIPVGVRNIIATLPYGFGESLESVGFSGRSITALRIPSLLASGHHRFHSMVSKVDRVIAVCSWVRDALLANDVPGGKITLCRQGLARNVDEGAFESANNPASRSGATLSIGYFGRLDATKGIDTLIEALRRAPEADVRLRIFGLRQSGSERYTDSLERAIARDKRINMESAVDSRAVTAIMRACDLVAVPSQWLETGPLVVYEAFAAGTPVLGSRLGGIAELVSDGIDGVLVDPTDIDAWSAAIRSLAGDRGRVARLQSGIRPPRTMDNVACEMAQVYRSVLATNGVHPTQTMVHRPRGRSRNGLRVLFIQATEPGGYPPLINASALMSDAGWDVTFLSSPVGNASLPIPAYPGITVRKVRPRTSHVMSKYDYLAYGIAAARLAKFLKPDIVYASDPLGAGPGRLAAILAGAALVYHEHDTPAPGTLRPWIARQRFLAAKAARLVIVPNEGRAGIIRSELGISQDRVQVVWNVPRKRELPKLGTTTESPLIAYYHGNISPELVPLALVEAVRGFGGRVRLKIVGYEAPGSPGYVARLVELSEGPDGVPLVDYVGPLPRHKLLQEAARAHVGIALMPSNSYDINMCNMTGASNKAFDYMAAGLALLVNDMTDWRRMFVTPGYARACNAEDPAFIADQLSWFLAHADERQAMAIDARAKIETDWNYEVMFDPVMHALSEI